MIASTQASSTRTSSRSARHTPAVSSPPDSRSTTSRSAGASSSVASASLAPDTELIAWPAVRSHGWTSGSIAPTSSTPAVCCGRTLNGTRTDYPPDGDGPGDCSCASASARRRAAGRAARRGRTRRWARRLRATTTPVAATPARPARPSELPGTPQHARRLGPMTDTLTLDEAVAGAATGDIWLFRGRSVADLAIRTVTNAPVNHVGMVVALDDLPPLLWHAELGRSLPDVWTGSASAACSCTGSRRRAHLERALRPARVDAPARGHDRARARGPPDGGDRALRRARVPDHGRARTAVARPAAPPARSSLETIYCAELVATTYQAHGPPAQPTAGELVRPGRGSGAATASRWCRRSRSAAKWRSTPAPCSGRPPARGDRILPEDRRHPG